MKNMLITICFVVMLGTVALLEGCGYSANIFLPPGNYEQRISFDEIWKNDDFENELTEVSILRNAKIHSASYDDLTATQKRTVRCDYYSQISIRLRNAKRFVARKDSLYQSSLSGAKLLANKVNLDITNQVERIEYQAEKHGCATNY